LKLNLTISIAFVLHVKSIKLRRYIEGIQKLKTAITDIGKRKHGWFANNSLFYFELVSALQSTIETSRYSTILILHFHNHWYKTGYSFWLNKIEKHNKMSSNTNYAIASQVLMHFIIYSKEILLILQRLRLECAFILQ